MVFIPQADPRQHDAAQLDMTEIPDTDPHDLFALWYELASANEPADPNAFTLATQDQDGMPDARILLFKGFAKDGLTFYTNSHSAKGKQIANQPVAAAVVHWKSILRQVRLRGPVVQVSDSEADMYFQSRARNSQLGAWASDQSHGIESRDQLEAKYHDIEKYFGDGPIPRPPHWTGFRIEPVVIEFWKNGPFRLHHRRRFYKNDQMGWASEVLSP